MEKIGLIAGNKRFPILFAESARKNNRSVIAIAIKGDTSASLKQHVDKIYWLALRDFSRLFDILKQEGLTKVAMVGQITPTRIFSRDITKDPLLRELLATIEDKKADTIFGAIAHKIEESGCELLDSTMFLKDCLPGKGVLTKRAPGFEEWEDIYFGFEIAKEIAFLDIGQTVAVKNKAVVAVEALEGTDNLIRRAGWIIRRGAVIVKVSKPHQDSRFDMPVVGLETVKNLIKAQAHVLAIEAGKTLFIDREESLRLAERRHLCVVAV